MIANLQKAIWDKEVVTIGGGQFSGEELRLLLRQVQLGRAVEAVSEQLPEGCEVIVSLEKGAGTVVLIDADGNEYDVEGDDTFAYNIRHAITLARSLP